MVATYALRDYYEATADARVPTVLSNYCRYMLAHLPSRPLADWGKARAGDQMDVLSGSTIGMATPIFSRSSTCYVSRLMIGPEFSRAIISCSTERIFTQAQRQR